MKIELFCKILQISVYFCKSEKIQKLGFEQNHPLGASLTNVFSPMSLNESRFPLAAKEDGHVRRSEGDIRGRGHIRSKNPSKFRDAHLHTTIMSALKSTYKSSEIEPFYIGSAAASVSSNGQILATALNEDVVITDLSTNTIIHTVEGDGELITNLRLTPDGTKLAILSQSQQLRVYDLEEAEIVQNHKLSSPVYMSAADPSSSLFAFGGADGAITVWDVGSGYVTHSLKGHGATICSLAFYGELNTTNWRLASGDTMGTVKIWDLVKRKCVLTMNEHASAARGLGFDKTGAHFVSGGRDQIVVVYETTNLRKPVHTLSVKHQVESCGFVEVDGQLVLYTAGADSYLRLWDLSSGRVLGHSTRPLETNEELMVVDVVGLENERLFMVVSDQTLVEIAVSEPHTAENGLWELPVVRRIAGNHGTIADVRFVGPDLGLLALATNAPALRVVDPAKPLETALFEGHTDLLNTLDVSNDGLWVATGSKDNEAILWQWSEERAGFSEFARFQGHAGAITAIALPKADPHGAPKFVLTGSSDLTVKKWKVPKTGGAVKTSDYTRRAHDKDINALAVSPNDEFFATASYDKTAKVWAVDGGETVAILKGHKRGLWDVSFCQYDRLLVTASGDKTAKVWLLHNYTCTATLEGHTNAVQRARFLNRNQQVVTSGADGLVKMWDAKAGDVVCTLSNHENRIWALDVKNDGDELVSADADGRVSLWADNSEETRAHNEREAKERVEKEQRLSNYMAQKDWSNAFLLAITLNHAMKVYNVVKQAIVAGEDRGASLGSHALERTIVGLNDEQLVALARKVRDWNVNFKLFEIAQKVLHVLVRSGRMDPEIKGLNKIMDAIVPYNERHYARLDDLLENTYMLDYAVEEMDKTLA